MSDDIVARLRTLTNTLLLGDFQGLAATTASAADEIERLRAERDEATKELCKDRRSASKRGSHGEQPKQG